MPQVNVVLGGAPIQVVGSAAWCSILEGRTKLSS